MRYLMTFEKLSEETDKKVEDKKDDKKSTERKNPKDKNLSAKKSTRTKKVVFFIGENRVNINKTTAPTAKKLAEFKKGSVKISEVETEAYLDEKDSIIFKHKGAWYKGLVNGEHNGVKYKINFQSK